MERQTLSPQSPTKLRANQSPAKLQANQNPAKLQANQSMIKETIQVLIKSHRKIRNMTLCKIHSHQKVQSLKLLKYVNALKISMMFLRQNLSMLQSRITRHLVHTVCPHPDIKTNYLDHSIREIKGLA
jgi:succinylglutamate desuccinylase